MSNLYGHFTFYNSYSSSILTILTFLLYCLMQCEDHDAAMAGYSVKGQHCDLKHGEWKQQVYPFSDTCEVKWYTQWFSPQEQVFGTDRCSNGLKLDYCNEGPCPDVADDAADLTVKSRSVSLRGHAIVGRLRKPLWN